MCGKNVTNIILFKVKKISWTTFTLKAEMDSFRYFIWCSSFKLDLNGAPAGHQLIAMTSQKCVVDVTHYKTAFVVLHLFNHNILNPMCVKYKPTHVMFRSAKLKGLSKNRCACNLCMQYCDQISSQHFLTHFKFEIK